MNRYTNESHTQVESASGTHGTRETLIRLNYLKESDVIEPYVEPVPSAEEIFTSAIQPLVSGISQLERDTFERQEREALEWIADNSAPAVFIRGLGESRGIELDVLVAKIIIKADYYSSELAKALGVMHKAEDAAV
tara:strand:+ start:601 stop:1008 length:408 start_codon:yes stop_codon:yes gene_type:complete